MKNSRPCLDGQERQTQVLKSIDHNFFDLKIFASICHGHGIASKASTRYPQGTIALQYPVFKEMGLDLSHCYGGTLNLSIAPKNYKIITPKFNLKDVDWYPARGQTENFLICDCAIKIGEGYISTYVYQPDPSTKIEYFDDPQALQIISPYIDGLDESKPIEIFLSSKQIEIL